MSNLSKVIDELIKQVDAKEVLKALNADNIRPQTTKWIIHSCLIDRFSPHHANGDANPSAAINAKTKRYSCFAYGGMSLRNLLLSLLETEEEVYSFLVNLETVEQSSLTESLKAILFPAPVEQKRISLDLSILEAYSDNHFYMAKRGLDIPTLKLHSVKFDEQSQAVIFPLFEDGELLGIQRRNTVAGKPKYVNPTLFCKESYVYYTVPAKTSESIIVVESIVSALKLAGLGYPAVATLGSIIFDEQLPKLLRHKSMTLWFDDDFAGMKGVRNFINLAGTKIDLKVVVSDIGGKDPADMSSKEIERNLNNAMPLLEAKSFIDKAYELLKEQR